MAISEKIDEIILNNIRQMIDNEHKTQSTANHEPWLPKKKDNGKPILENTGKLKSGYQYFSNNNIQSVTNNTSYFKEATKEREVFPDELPKEVKNNITAEIKALFNSELKSEILSGIKR